MRTVDIRIAGEDHRFAYCLKALFLFEQLSGRPFELKKLQDFYIMYFCCFLAADPSFMDCDFARFIDACDDDPTLAESMHEALLRLSRAQNAVDNRDTEDSADDKKKD